MEKEIAFQSKKISDVYQTAHRNEWQLEEIRGVLSMILERSVKNAEAASYLGHVQNGSSSVIKSKLDCVIRELESNSRGEESGNG